MNIFWFKPGLIVLFFVLILFSSPGVIGQQTADKNRDMLHSASGKLIDFSESYKLCGQCHGPKLRDWKAGIHGRRTGQWNGEKQYLLCAHCHNPHSPKFPQLKPEPAPHEGCCRKMHILYPTNPGRPVPGMCGSLPRRRTKIREPFGQGQRNPLHPRKQESPHS